MPSPSSSAPHLRPSRGPWRQLVQRGASVLVIAPLLPGTQHRPLPLPPEWLEHFSLRMSRAGQRAFVSRMAFDRVYARERLVWAQTHGNAELKALAAELRAALRG